MDLLVLFLVATGSTLIAWYLVGAWLAKILIICFLVGSIKGLILGLIHRRKK